MMHDVKIKHAHLATPVVEVDGENIASQLEALQLTLAANQPATLTLEARSKAFEFEGAVEVQVIDPEHDRKAIVAFLDEVDGAWLEEAVANDPAMGEGVGTCALRLLKQRAREA